MKKRRLRLRTKAIIAVVVAAVIIFIFLFLGNAAKVIISFGTASLRADNTKAVNLAVEEVMSGLEYSDIVTVTYDSSGDVSVISANSSKINLIARRAASITQSKFESLASGGLEIPVGAFTGIEALSGYGATVKISVRPVASVECSFVSRFTQAGINQTVHSIYLEVVSDISIVLAARTERVLLSAEVLVLESLINGKVPEIYLQGGLLGSGSLVP